MLNLFLIWWNLKGVISCLFVSFFLIMCCFISVVLNLVRVVWIIRNVCG